MKFNADRMKRSGEMTMFSREEVLRAHNFLWQREEKRRWERERRRQEIIQEVKKAVEAVAPSFAVERVYLYGSLLYSRWRPDSDVDLAVDGVLSYGDLLALWAELDARVDQDVDLRDLARLPFREKVEREGILVYERKVARPAK
ncbi:nucleotidyltransferase domain-containing protein [Desulfovirgula thermocuniculi]|uniref:nucleotidyltransferase domain-containing protein n=1 Tax=Desulfovirgula thermocuniculi TaxID=348842 RepID=UPI000426F6E3|nr:nucleotidyltransferase domain-containing protein [Desulfovirgula thermocuniculi]